MYVYNELLEENLNDLLVRCKKKNIIYIRVGLLIVHKLKTIDYN